MPLISGGRMSSFASEDRKAQKAFYNSKAWIECRDAYRSQSKGLCERCLAKGIIKAGDHVHHKIRMSLEQLSNPEVAYNFDNLELLCAACHREEHKEEFKYHQKRRKRRYVVDEYGRVEGI